MKYAPPATIEKVARANRPAPAYICQPFRVIPPALQLVTASLLPVLKAGDKIVKANENGKQDPPSSMSPIPFLRTALRLEHRNAERNRTARRTEAATATSQIPFCRDAA